MTAILSSALKRRKRDGDSTEEFAQDHSVSGSSQSSGSGLERFLTKLSHELGIAEILEPNRFEFLAAKQASDLEQATAENNLNENALILKPVGHTQKAAQKSTSQALNPNGLCINNTTKHMSAKVDGELGLEVPIKITDILPMELWIRIWKYAAQGRVIKIIGTLQGMRLDPTLSRHLHGALFMTKEAHEETIKTHRPAFGQVFGNPILFNRNEDVLHLQEGFGDCVNLRHPHFDSARQARVRYLAIGSFGDSVTIAKIVRTFGSVEILYLLASREQDSNVMLGVKYQVQKAIDDQMAQARINWRVWEAQGKIVRKWRIPIVEVILHGGLIRGMVVEARRPQVT